MSQLLTDSEMEQLLGLCKTALKRGMHIEREHVFTDEGVKDTQAKLDRAASAQLGQLADILSQILFRNLNPVKEAEVLENFREAGRKAGVDDLAVALLLQFQNSYGDTVSVEDMKALIRDYAEKVKERRL